MTMFSMIAVYFVIWWLTLFAVLPFGLKTQAEQGEIVKGTVPSAPAKMHFKRLMLTNTLVAAIVFAAWYGVTEIIGFDHKDLAELMLPRES